MAGHVAWMREQMHTFWLENLAERQPLGRPMYVRWENTCIYPYLHS